MMLMVELVVVFVVNFTMVKVVFKGMEEQFISKQPDLRSLFRVLGHALGGGLNRWRVSH